MPKSSAEAESLKDIAGFQNGHIPKIVRRPLHRKLRLENSYKICVSGAAAGTMEKHAIDATNELGRQIALQGAILVTGATTGLPFIAARGNYSVGGIAIGFSPASSAKEHVYSYRLPTDFHDLIVYTGFNYSGRNLLLTRASDAVITVGGRIGTLNEFTIAFEDKKICGILETTGGMADHIREILRIGKRRAHHVIFDSDPKRLVERIIALLRKGYQAEGATHDNKESF